MTSGWVIFRNHYDPCHPYSARWNNTWDGYDVFETQEAAADYAAKHLEGPPTEND